MSKVTEETSKFKEMAMIRKTHDWIRKKLGMKTIPRLHCGTPARLGLRVVLVREVLEGWGIGHHYDDKVHTITSMTFLESGTSDIVGLGAKQRSIRALRNAPETSGSVCKNCEGWPDMMDHLGHHKVAKKLREAMQ